LGNIIILFGVVFLGVALFLGHQFAGELHVAEGQRVSLFSLAVLGMMTSVFALVSCGIVALYYSILANRTNGQALTVGDHIHGQVSRKLTVSQL
jgi:hypothetical protein